MGNFTTKTLPRSGLLKAAKVPHGIMDQIAKDLGETINITNQSRQVYQSSHFIRPFQHNESCGMEGIQRELLRRLRRAASKAARLSPTASVRSFFLRLHLGQDDVVPLTIHKGNQLRRQAGGQSGNRTATASISTAPPFGRAATCTAERAGGTVSKNSA